MPNSQSENNAAPSQEGVYAQHSAGQVFRVLAAAVKDSEDEQDNMAKRAMSIIESMATSIDTWRTVSQSAAGLAAPILAGALASLSVAGEIIRQWREDSDESKWALTYLAACRASLLELSAPSEEEEAEAGEVSEDTDSS